MKKIINDVLYDTEKATLITTYKDKKSFGPGSVKYHNIALYKSKNGLYFGCVPEMDFICDLDEDVVREEVREIDPDAYVKFFGRDFVDA